MKDLPNNLRKERIKNGMSIQELAKLTGINEQSLEGYEEGKQEVPLEDFVHLVNVLHTTAGSLLNGEEMGSTKHISEEIKERIEKMTSEELNQLFVIIENFLSENHNK